MTEKRLDFWLVMATVIFLLILSMLCMGSMFYFKAIGVHELPLGERLNYIEQMNALAAPMVAALILALILCIPKRIIKGRYIVWAWGGIVVFIFMGWLVYGVKKALLGLVILSIIVQLVVLIYAISRPSILHIQKSGYWIRIGSPLIHLAILFFILDLYLYKQSSLHMTLFWLTTVSATLGMIFCFWADSVSHHVKRLAQRLIAQKLP